MGVEWDYGPNTRMSTKEISKRLRREIHLPGIPILSGPRPTEPYIEATYEVPFLAHAALEPMNCTAHVLEDLSQCEVWVPTQAQASVQYHVAELLGIPQPSVTVHTTFLGGAFGRRLNVDFVLQAVKASRAVGQPVKLIWSREEDTRQLDENNNLISWEHRLVAPPFVPDWLGLDDFPSDPAVAEHEAIREAFEAVPPEDLDSHIETLQAQTDSTEATASKPEGIKEEIVERFVAGFIATEGAVVEASEAATDAVGHRTQARLVGLPYNIRDGQRVVYVAPPRLRDRWRMDVPLGFLRAVGPSYNMFFIESMIDEVAAVAGQDPVAFRQ